MGARPYTCAYMCAYVRVGLPVSRVYTVSLTRLGRLSVIPLCLKGHGPDVLSEYPRDKGPVREGDGRLGVNGFSDHVIEKTEGVSSL